MTVLAFRNAADWEAAIVPVREHCKAGGLLAYPTETVYGLGSLPTETHLARLTDLKDRAPSKPFLLLVGSRQMADNQGLEFTKAARALSDRFWPGPLTLVLKGREDTLPDALRGPEGGFAVRWTAHKGIETLVNGLDTPITSTSANRPGGPTAPGVEALIETFGNAVRDGTLLVLDGGVLGNVPPSTVVDCTEDRPRVIRPGAIPLEELRADVGSLAP